MDVDGISENEVRHALEAVRHGESPRATPLSRLGAVHRRVQEAGEPLTPDRLAIAVESLLSDVVRTNLARCRDRGPGGGCTPTPRDAPASALADDFASRDGEREAWSVLYYRYIRRPPLPVKQIAAIARPGHVYADRHVRLRVVRGVAALTSVLRDMARDDPDTARRHNLPVAHTRFVGREREIGEVRALLSTHRLVTLTGPGGIGKSRLATEVARALAPDYADGAWLVELEAVGTGGHVAATVAAALGVRIRPGHAATDLLGDHLAARHTLVVLDNCEHIVPACAALSETVLRRCGDVQILATSRERLRVPGEVAWAVPSLSLPDPDGPIRASMLAHSDAVRLFTDRAAKARPDFAVTERNARDVVTLCRTLDGLPLALELAAARAGTCTTAELAAHLADHLDLPDSPRRPVERGGGSVRARRSTETRAHAAGAGPADSGGNADAAGPAAGGGDATGDAPGDLAGDAGRHGRRRHVTLRRAIDWSHDLLAEHERVLFRRLAVFRGGWTLPAALAVCAGHPLVEAEVADLLADVADKSLVVPPNRTIAERWDMLRTVRQYASDRLEASGEARLVHDRHLAWCARLGEETARATAGHASHADLDRLAIERANLSAALEWACSDGDAESGLRLGGSLVTYWLGRGHWREGRDILARITARPGIDQDGLAYAKALDARGALIRQLGQREEARALHEQALAVYRRMGNEVGVAGALCRLGNVVDALGRPDEARACYEESLAIHRRLGLVFGIADVLGNLGIMAYDRGDYVAADALLTESLTAHRELGNREGEGRQLNMLAGVAKARGDARRAQALWEESLVGFRAVGNTDGVAIAMANLGELALLAGDWDQAQAQFEESLETFRAVGNAACTAVATMSLGAVARKRGDLVTARERLSECLRLHMAIGERLYLSFALDEAAKLAVAENAPARAARLAGAAEGIRAALGAAQPPDLAEDLERELAPARAALGEVAFAALWAKGQAIGVEEAVGVALGA